MAIVRRRFWVKEDAPDYVAGKAYTTHQIELMANAMLKADSKQEMCRKCGEQGAQTGVTKTNPQYARNEKDEVVEDLLLTLVFHELSCPEGHLWFEGEGKTKGLKGEYPVLLEEHLIARKRREIHTENGTPDPNIVSGIFNRSHPLGRRINSEASRLLHGASYYS